MKKKIIGIFIMTLFLFSVYGSATKTNQNNEILDQSQTFMNFRELLSPTHQIAQSFVPSLNKLTKVQLYLIKTGNPSYSDIIFSIKDSQSETNLAIVEKSVGEISTGWLELDFEDLNIIPKKFYYIVCKPIGEWDWNFENAIFWGGSKGNPYLPGISFIIYNLKWDEEYSFDPIDYCFKTYGFNNTPPNKPTINGDINGTPDTQYQYTFVSTDQDENEISYYIDWGDNTPTGWTRTLPSGKYYNSSHIWSEKGSYIIKAKAKDTYGAESDWATLLVSMPKYKMNYQLNILFERFLRHFLFFEKILNQYYN